MRHYFALCCLAGIAGLAARPAFAQAPSPPAAAPDTAPPTLAQALALSRPGEVGIVALSVGAEGQVVAPGVTLTRADAPHRSPAQLAKPFGRTVHRFGTVDALAPPTMKIVHPAPTQPRPWDGMPPGDALKLLAATLSPAQWQALLGTRGLGLGDLADEKQRGLFRSLFPGNRLTVAAITPGAGFDPAMGQDKSGSLSQVRVRLGSHVSLGLSVPGEPNSHTFTSAPPLPNAPKRYVQANLDGFWSDRVDGATVHTVAANRPKAGQLDTSAAVLQKDIPVAGLRTVEGVLARITAATGIEIIADHRYEVKSVTFAGASKAASAGDLLRGIAFCVTGTYRRVGERTWVLTDDLIGAGTRHQQWVDFEAAGKAARKARLEAAGDVIFEAQPYPKVTPMGDALAFSKEQRDLTEKKLFKGHQLNAFLPSVDVPFDQLTPAQQDEARRLLKTFADRGEADHASLGGTITVQAQMRAEAIVPGLDSPVELGMRVDDLFKPSDNAINAVLRSPDATPPRPRPAQPQPPAPDILAATAALPRRAVYARAESRADIDALLVSLSTMGFNELWLDGFSARTSAQVGKDLLAYAITAGKARNIKIWGAADLFVWRETGASPAARDVNICGETAGQAHTRRMVPQLAALFADAPPDYTHRAFAGVASPPLAPAVTVSPFAPDVMDTLAATLHAIGSLPGIAGVVVRGLVPPGYGEPLPDQGGYIAQRSTPEMGYAPATRLAFVRASHADPVDLYQTPYGETRADTSLPELDDLTGNPALLAAWGTFRYPARLTALARLRRAVPAGVPVIAEAQEHDRIPAWYGLWETPAAPPQVHLGMQNTGPGAAKAAHTQSPVAFVPLLLGADPPASLLTEQLFGVGAWDGIVLDTVTPAFMAKVPPSSLAVLLRLVGKSFAPEKPGGK